MVFLQCGGDGIVFPLRARSGDLRPQLCNTGFLLFRGKVHMVCQPLQGFHTVRKLDFNTVLALTNLCHQRAVYLVQRTELQRTPCFLPGFQKIRYIRKGDINIFLENISGVQ